MNEIWEPYQDFDIPIDKYEVIKFVYDSNGVSIKVEGVNVSLSIWFDYPQAVRMCDEGVRIRTYHEVEGLQEYRKNFIGNPIFKITNSSFNYWTIEECGGIYTNNEHYAIVTINDIVDVISSTPPRIEIEAL